MSSLVTAESETIAPPPGRGLVLTESAARRINALNALDGTRKMFRVTVQGGGCSGYQYEFKLDDHRGEDDVAFERDGATLVTDEISLGLIAGSEVDFAEDLMGAYFQVRNPNATSSCGCGTSFAIG